MMIRAFFARVVALFRRRQWDDDFDAELASHLEFAIDANLARGLSPREARRQALIALGGIEVTKEVHRDSRGLPAVDALLQDLRYAFRMLRHNAALTGFAVVSVGLGVGASATVFSVVRAPLPFEDAGRLVWIQNDMGPTRSDKTIQAAHLIALHNDARRFDDIAAYSASQRQGAMRLTSPGEPERLTGVRITPRFFETLGVRPLHGRFFAAEEILASGSDVVIISHRLWQRRFDADPSIVGHSLMVNETALTIVGVLPASFDFATVFQPGSPVDLFTPFLLNPRNNRRGNTLFLVARMRPDATLEGAAADVAGIAARSSADPDLNEFVPAVATLRDHVIGESRTAMVLLAGAVGLTMLIVCANLTNLLLTRASGREREMAVRAALGASRGRLVRQMLTESVVLSCAGAAFGLGLAVAGTRLLAGLESLRIPLRPLIQVDVAALGFTLALAVATALVFGLTPALRVSSLAVVVALKEGGRTGSGRRRRAWTRGSLVVCEIALTCMLLIATGLLTRSFARLLDADLGFQPQSIAAIRIDPGSPFAERARDLIYLDEALRRARSAPGIESAALSDALPLGFNRAWVAGAAGRVYRRGEKPDAYVHVVSEGYLEAMGISIVAGRDLRASDDGSAPPVALINDTLAGLLWPGESPIGRIVDSGLDEQQVVGVVGDVRHLAVDRNGGSEIYLPVRQTGDYAAIHLVVRGALPAAELVTIARKSIQAVNPAVPLTELIIMQDVVDESISS